jgi:hypothetical protein
MIGCLPGFLKKQKKCQFSFPILLVVESPLLHRGSLILPIIDFILIIMLWIIVACFFCLNKSYKRLVRGLSTLREGVHVSRFSPYITVLDPTGEYMKTPMADPRACIEVDVGTELNNFDEILKVAAEYGNETMAVIVI